MVYNLGEQNSLVGQFLLELRDENIQHDRMRFRKNMERLGGIMAYEISKKLSYRKLKIESPLSATHSMVLENQPVLITIMRAGLAYFQGFVNFFDQADCGFIGAYRKEGEEEVAINLDYLATPSLEGKNVIVIDPMLATGRSFIRSVSALLERGLPAHMHLAALISVPEGIKYIEDNMKIPYTLWTCALDEKLNQKFYIVPGLGDAGDLSFGEKI